METSKPKLFKTAAFAKLARTVNKTKYIMKAKHILISQSATTKCIYGDTRTVPVQSMQTTVQ
jgi:hypothetical protein